MSVTNSSSVSTSSRITALRIKGLAVKGLQICGRFINGGCDETGTKYFYSVWKEDKNVHFFFLFEITMFTAVPNWCHPTNFWASNSRSIFKCSSMSLKLSWLMNGIIFFRSVEMFSPHTKRCHLFDFFSSSKRVLKTEIGSYSISTVFIVLSTSIAPDFADLIPRACRGKLPLLLNLTWPNLTNLTYLIMTVRSVPI